ncbi:MAG: putative bifunctional diguanylate cyclase/phosphodiesterase [Methylovirgula sp.]
MILKDIRWRIWRRAQIWRHTRRDADLYNHLVGSLFTSQSSLNSANLLGMAVAGAGYLLTSDKIYLLLAAVMLVAGIGRTSVFRGFVRHKDKPTTRAGGAHYDRLFFIYSVLFTAAFGLTCYALIRHPASTGTHAVAAGAAVGYAMGVVARNAGRPYIVVVQVMLTICPMIVGYALMHNTYGNVAVLLLSGTMLATVFVTFSLHQNVIAVYNADKTTRHLAMFDKLTGLMNRHTFGEQVSQAIAAEPEKKFAILYLDLDRFKEINDTMGHTAGDAVIVEVSRRLRAVTRTGDLIARFGGDEFLIKLACTEPSEIERIVRRIAASLSQPVSVEGKVFAPTASIGAAVFPDNGLLARDIIKKADIALYEAKRAGGKTYRIFVPEMESEMHAQRTLRNEVQLAVDRHEFVLHYQPIYELASKKIIAVEALLRWNHPTRGLLPPGAFIAVSEQTMAIVEMGEQILEAACQMALKLPDDIAVAVNLSPIQFHQPEQLINAVRSALQRTGLPARRLHLEITETLLLANTPSTRKTLDILAGMGAKLVLDDFGTGYSSLSYIQDFPFSKIKIDKKFTDSLYVNTASSAIIKAITQIAKDLALEIVVEGIETAEQESFVRMLGPTQGQGFLFCKPLPEADLLARLSQPASDTRRMSLAS